MKVDESDWSFENLHIMNLSDRKINEPARLVRTTHCYPTESHCSMLQRPSTPEPLELLSHVELFHELDGEQVAALSELIQLQTFANGDIIFRQGSDGEQMYVIASGQVEIRIHDKEEQGYAAVYLGSGQVFGEMALIDDGPRSATVIAVEDNTQVYGFPIQSFNELCKRNTAIGYILMRNLAQDLSFKLRHRHFDTSASQE
jgi:CRP/FNR family cyclic AMP-dependent transcriptional regulator